jgi:hypothetical protein
VAVVPRAIKSLIIIVLTTAILIALVELFLFITVRFPAVHKVLPSRITNISRRIYVYHDMHIPTFTPEGGRFDRTLGYTSKPGTFFFSTNESTVECRINSLGVRDTEAALDSPEIVVLGDSYAWGWGVKQNETFAKILEAKTGLKVLNAGVPSYGTAREFMLLKRIKRDKLKYLIIQYCDNDYPENTDFYNSGNKLITMSKEKYEKTVKNYLDNSHYYFGKFLIAGAEIIKNNFSFLFKVGDYKTIKKKMYKRPLNEAGLFLNVLLHSGVDLSGVQLIVFSATVFDPSQNGFVISLRREIASGEYPPFIKKMIILDATKFLNSREHVFVLDGHFNPQGHRIVADKLAQQIIPGPNPGPAER